jgi:hypothetical protein
MHIHNDSRFYTADSPLKTENCQLFKLKTAN